MYIDLRRGKQAKSKRPPVGRYARRIVTLYKNGQVLTQLIWLWQAYRSARIIAASNLFDPDWYARDGMVTGSPMRLALHYVLRGASQGRNPSADFDTCWYSARYPEVGLAGLNPLVHYITQGRPTGLEIKSAPAAALPRQPISQDAYHRWIAEMAKLTTPFFAQLGNGLYNLPRVSVAGAGPQDADYVLLLPQRVGLSRTALLEIRLALSRSPGTELLFADEDCIDAEGIRHSPWFKPGWDPDLMLAGDLTGPATVMHRRLLRRIGWNGAKPDAAELEQLNRTASGVARGITHLPSVLFHRPAPPALTYVRFASPSPPPLVSIIVPFRDRAGLLRVLAEGILHNTAYDPLELILVDNDSRERATRRLLTELSRDTRVRVARAPGEFNWSALNNIGARIARGTVLVMLNNDTEIVSPGWLGELVAQALRPDVGAVGAKLLYPTGTIQHAGLSVDTAGHFCHIMRGASGDDHGPFGELAVTRTVPAVTGACLAIRRTIFWAVGGLDEEHLRVTHNDIDLCLRVRGAGYRVVYTPEAVLIHREAATRGRDFGEAQFERVKAERTILRQRWGRLGMFNPYQNPNLCTLHERPALEAPVNVLKSGGMPLALPRRNETCCVAEPRTA